MTVLIRLGQPAEVDAAVSVYERSNLARHQGDWPNQAAGAARVRANLNDPATWFLLAQEGPVWVGMAAAKPLRGDGGAGLVVPGGCFLSYLFVVPERWGQGLGGAMLDASVAEAHRRHHSRMHLWTADDNERAQRLYRSRGFVPTGRAADGRAEWALTFGVRARFDEIDGPPRAVQREGLK